MGRKVGTQTSDIAWLATATPPKTNIAAENKTSHKESRLPTIVLRGYLLFLGSVQEVSNYQHKWRSYLIKWRLWNKMMIMNNSCIVLLMAEILLTSWGWWFIPLFIGFQHHPGWLFGISAINSSDQPWSNGVGFCCRLKIRLGSRIPQGCPCKKRIPLQRAVKTNASKSCY